ncbi:hypothetical protein [Thiohalospira halophila]|uniref:hypothetical protein n=1 Tax=Thiohalospira halophila TaxID=381300 RepID=UPI000B874258|nr:hypothetical protein [Thiohalospira halophila]
MSQRLQWRQVRLADIVADGDEESIQLSHTDARLLASLPPESREWLSLLRPMLVTEEEKEGDKAYRLQAGHVTYQALRASLRPKEEVTVVLLPASGPPEVIEALELLALPAVEGAGSAPGVRGRWIAAHESRPELLRLAGLESPSLKAVADHLGVTRQTLVNDRRSRKGDDDQ